MTMPSPYGQPFPGQSFQVPTAADRQASIGSIFTVALLKAGRQGCECESCRLLKRIVDLMEQQLEVTSGASQG